MGGAGTLSGEEQAQRFDDPAQTIRVAMGEPFALALAGNPTTGYLWQADVDERYLELLGQEFEPRGAGVGAGGQEVLCFKTRRVGETEIICKHMRPWEAKVCDTKHFRVVIAK